MNSYPDCYGEMSYKVPRIAKVSIEEVGGDLCAGAKTRNLKDVDFRPSVYRTKDVETVTSADGNHVVTLESFCRIGDVDGNNLWGVFKRQGLLLLKDTYRQTANSNNNYVKVYQSFHVSVTQNTCVPYIQFVCEAKRVKYQGCWFHQGDIITIVVRHKNMPKGSDPRIISVRPRTECAYVVMVPKYKLQIITDQSLARLEFNGDTSSSLFYHGQELIDSEYAEKFHVRCDLFECMTVPRVQELFFVNSRSNNTCKVICIPAFFGDYPLLIDPMKTCMLYMGDTEGFLLRSRKHMQFTVENNCPLRAVYTVDRNDYCETKVKVTKPQPFFILERAKQFWVAKNIVF